MSLKEKQKCRYLISTGPIVFIQDSRRSARNGNIPTVGFVRLTTQGYFSLQWRDPVIGKYHGGAVVPKVLLTNN